MLNLSLDINGEQRSATVDGSTTLLRVLREQLALTGTKRGCDYGVCGACTVLIDGNPARSCLSIAADCVESRITTIEGLTAPGSLSGIQQALLDAGAVQCGYCTPGIVMALRALLNENPAPDEQAVRSALGGNLCRCTGYSAIVQAALTVTRKASRESEREMPHSASAASSVTERRDG